jgi:hypothetical protein
MSDMSVDLNIREVIAQIDLMQPEKATISAMPRRCS